MVNRAGIGKRSGRPLDASQARRRTVARLRVLLRYGREKLGAGMPYWQAGGATRAAAKRAKRP